MGGRKQKKKINLDWASKEASVSSNYSVPSRNLRKTDLGAVIFGTTYNTINECLSSQLFGLPEGHYSYIRNINQGLVLFLFNYSDRKLHGIFEAASPGQMNIDQYAWVADGDDTGYTRYPAQVKIRVRKLCQPLSENQFGPLIANNYYEKKLFYFELDHDQTKELIKLFKSVPVNSSVATKWNNLYSSLPVTSKREKYNAPVPPGMTNRLEPDVGRQGLPENPNQISKVSYGNVLGRTSTTTTTTTVSSSHPTGKWNALLKTKSDFETTNDDQYGSHASNVYEDKGEFLQENTWEESQPINTTTDEVMYGQTWEVDLSPQANTLEESQLIATTTDGMTYGQTLEADLGPPANTWKENQPIDTTIDEVTNGQTWEVDLSLQANGTRDELPLNQEDEDNPDCQLSSSTEKGESDIEEIHEKDNSSVPNTVEEMSTDLQPLVVKLMEEVEGMKGSQLKQIVKINMLEQELDKSKQEIQQLTNRISILESGSRSIADPAEVDNSKSGSKFVDSVFIVGGWDGYSCLSDLYSYFPSHDFKISLCPMNFVKKYASAATLNGELYHFGGEGFHTVESFNLTNNQWIPRPPLYWKNIHVAGASINDRLFVVGGASPPTPSATERQCSSEVEYLDLNIGKWLPARSMQSKRLAPAAAELNNVLYVSGGYDGVSYSSSVERFDAREEAWYKLPSMNARKGCHSMVVLNEKLYTIGGFNGDKLLATVESLDTRMGAWVETEPMNVSRGNFGAFVLGGKIYAIGGWKENNEVLDIVECYKEGSGWEVADNLKAIGKRSHFSAIVM